ncbi:unnamed protein product, partial [Vitis vinifera]|uniref:Uncharacterized protein n=1 Tax=Vitis vinifera TaxID=29760 RepID=D7TAU1_VITVI
MDLFLGDFEQNIIFFKI